MKHQKTKFIFSLFFVFIAFFQNALGQEREKLKGRIIVDAVESAAGVHVINLNAETGTTTNAEGEFIINAKEGDSIFFSSIQFENRTWIVRNSFFENENDIRLMGKMNELDEIQLDDIKLSGVLSSDINKVPKSIYEKLGLPFPKPRRSSLELEIQSAHGGGPLVSILNELNGKSEQLEKAEKNNNLSILVDEGLNLVGQNFFMDQLEIPENEIINFLFYCTDDPGFQKFVKAKNVFKLVEFYEAKVDSFMKWRELD